MPGAAGKSLCTSLASQLLRWLPWERCWLSSLAITGRWQETFYFFPSQSNDGDSLAVPVELQIRDLIRMCETSGMCGCAVMAEASCRLTAYCGSNIYLSQNLVVSMCSWAVLSHCLVVPRTRSAGYLSQAGNIASDPNLSFRSTTRGGILFLLHRFLLKINFSSKQNK